MDEPPTADFSTTSLHGPTVEFFLRSFCFFGRNYNWTVTGILILFHHFRPKWTLPCDFFLKNVSIFIFVRPHTLIHHVIFQCESMIIYSALLLLLKNWITLSPPVMTSNSCTNLSVAKRTHRECVAKWHCSSLFQWKKWSAVYLLQSKSAC